MAIEFGILVCAAFMLELEAGMRNAEAVAQAILDLALDSFNSRPAIRGQHNVVVERDLVFLHLPEMHMMNVPDTDNFPHHHYDILVINIWGTAK